MREPDRGAGARPRALDTDPRALDIDPRALVGDPRALWVLSAAILALPTVLAFFSGGFFDEPRLVAATGVWLAVAVAAVAGWLHVPRSGRLLLGGLGLLTLWTAVSLAWAPLAGRALDDAQRCALYLGYTALALSAFRPRQVARQAEPVIALGALIVVGYALAGRLLPGLIDQASGLRALGRLEQPLTYWNALGLLAALGLVLSARIAGDAERPRRLGVAAAAAAVPFGAAVYLTFSRGALAAVAVGFVALALLAPRRGELRGCAHALAAAVGGALCVAFLPDVSDPPLDPAAGQGGLALGLLLGATLASALAARRLGAPHGGERPVRRLALAALGGALLVVLVLVAAGVSGLGDERVGSGSTAGAQASRLRSTESERYEYWQVALSAFADRPLAGSGAGGFDVDWRRERSSGLSSAADAHSLYVETASELGLAGLLALALFLAGAGFAAARALRADPALAVGPAAALAAWAVHAGLDWDWEMPAVTLPALALAAALGTRSSSSPNRAA